MIDHIWSVLCERISIDRDTNLVSYLSCVEEITVNRLPFICPLLAFGSLWQTDHPSRDVLKFRLMLISPDGSEKNLIEPEDFIFEKQRHRTNVILNGIALEQAGIYLFRLQKWQVNTWDRVAEIPMRIAVQTETTKPVKMTQRK